MKQVFHKITAFLMALVVLFSTTSFTIDMHYCGDTLVDKAVFKKAKSCGMEMQMTAPTSECSFSKKNCCSDEQLSFQGQNELQVSLDAFSFDQHVFVISFVTTYLQLFDGIYQDTAFLEYPPPLIVKQIFKLDEAYLI
jgi:hypothetical protein